MKTVKVSNLIMACIAITLFASCEKEIIPTNNVEAVPNELVASARGGNAFDKTIKNADDKDFYLQSAAISDNAMKASTANLNLKTTYQKGGSLAACAVMSLSILDNYKKSPTDSQYVKWCKVLNVTSENETFLLALYKQFQKLFNYKQPSYQTLVASDVKNRTLTQDKILEAMKVERPVICRVRSKDGEIGKAGGTPSYVLVVGLKLTDNNIGNKVLLLNPSDKSATAKKGITEMDYDRFLDAMKSCSSYTFMQCKEKSNGPLLAGENLAE
jgi:hypothetical protein